MVIPFGIWGVMVWLWYWIAGFWVVWRNYHYGDPAIRHLNLLLYALFVTKVFSFLFIFGSVVEDVGGFGGLVGLSLALNHGVMHPEPQAQFNQAAPSPRLALPVRPAFQR